MSSIHSWICMGTDEGTGHEITESRCLQSAYGLSGTREVGLATLSMDDLEEGSVQSVQAKEKTPLKVPQKSKFQLTVQSMKGAERCYMFGYHMIPPLFRSDWWSSVCMCVLFFLENAETKWGRMQSRHLTAECITPKSKRHLMRHLVRHVVMSCIKIIETNHVRCFQSGFCIFMSHPVYTY